MGGRNPGPVPLFCRLTAACSAALSAEAALAALWLAHRGGLVPAVLPGIVPVLAASALLALGARRRCPPKKTAAGSGGRKRGPVR